MSAGDTHGPIGSDRPDCADRPPRPWPPSFPHAKIDELLARLEDGRTSDPDEAAELLRLIAREAQRLRISVTRLSMAKLDAAEQEACRVIARAYAHSEEVRSLALRAVDDRLDETESLLSAMRRSFLIEHAVSGNTVEQPRSGPERPHPLSDDDLPPSESPDPLPPRQVHPDSVNPDPLNPDLWNPEAMSPHPQNADRPGPHRSDPDPDRPDSDRPDSDRPGPR